jgi:hypothetical protein
MTFFQSIKYTFFVSTSAIRTLAIPIVFTSAFGAIAIILIFFMIVQATGTLAVVTMFVFIHFSQLSFRVWFEDRIIDRYIVYKRNRSFKTIFR